MHLTLYLCDVTLVPYLSSIGTTAGNARGNCPLAYLHLYGVLVEQEMHCLQINFVWTYIGNSRLARCGASIFPVTSVLWNSLLFSVFPAEFNLNYFNAHVC